MAGFILTQHRRKKKAKTDAKIRVTEAKADKKVARQKNREAVSDARADKKINRQDRRIQVGQARADKREENIDKGEGFGFKLAKTANDFADTVAQGYATAITGGAGGGAATASGAADDLASGSSSTSGPLAGLPLPLLLGGAAALAYLLTHKR